MLMGPCSSTVRGQSSKLVSVTLTATTGSAMNYSVSWHGVAATSCILTCSRIATPTTGTLPSTILSECCQKQRTTGWWWLDTQVMPAALMHLPTTTAWCSPRMTATMISNQQISVQTTPAVDSGTKLALALKWIVFTMGFIQRMTSAGVACLVERDLRPLECGCSASRLLYLEDTSQSADSASQSHRP